ncbi:Uncharacterised protein [Sphingobacterium thalpophilum]|uniref:Uncharacterized protein n=2 Tax=Sphingobacteriaceae TaxID=84566 RepID=A0A4U9UB21_9SPHI|nr:Uncharacterised protein [Sphingobacterium thalpophilum]
MDNAPDNKAKINVTDFMKTKAEENAYLPVAWEFCEMIKEQIDKKTTGKIFYFDSPEVIGEAQGIIIHMDEEKGKGVFINMDNGMRIRIDRIITLFGKIGAAYEEYNAFADACMDCNGGYTKEELEDM